jgi:hypothetical protein
VPERWAEALKYGRMCARSRLGGARPRRVNRKERARGSLHRSIDDSCLHLVLAGPQSMNRGTIDDDR